MNKLILVIAVLLCLLHDVQGMEVWGQTKIPEERALIINSRQSSYSSLFNPYNNSLEKEELDEFFKASVTQLSHDVKACIARMFVRVYLLQHDLNVIQSDSDPLGILNLLCRVQSRCPLVIGNKTFEWKDIIMLERKQQQGLFAIGDPSRCYVCCTGYDNVKFAGTEINAQVETLKKSPAHIKKDLIIEAYPEHAHPYGGHGLCMIAGCIGAGEAGAGAMLLNVCQMPISGFFSAFVPTVASIVGLFLLGGIACRIIPCCKFCGKKYAVDADKFL